jgi:hypothetical protein
MRLVEDKNYYNLIIIQFYFFKIIQPAKQGEPKIKINQTAEAQLLSLKFEFKYFM